MAKKALVGINTTIMNGQVLDVVSIGATFEVHTDLTWVDCSDTVQMNWQYDGSSFSNRRQGNFRTSKRQNLLLTTFSPSNLPSQGFKS